MPAPEPTTPDSLPWRNPWRRRALIAAAAIVAALALAIATVVVISGSLDQTWVKSRVQALARSSAGLEIDYRAARLGISGLHLEDVVVLSPEAMRPLAPELARIGELDVRWTISSLLGRDDQLVKAVSLRKVALTVVRDERGVTSLDLLSGPESKPPPPPIPLSHQAAENLGTASLLARLDLEDLTATLVRSEKGQMAERMALHGFSAHLTTQRANAGWAIRFEAGTSDAPLELWLDREEQGAARLKLRLAIAADPGNAEVAVDVRAVEQTLVPDFDVESLVHLDAKAHFDPAKGLTTLSLTRAEAADGAITAKATVELPDAGAPLVRLATGEVDLSKAIRHLPAGMVPAKLAGGRLTYDIAELKLGPTPGLAPTGKVAIDGALQGLEAAVAGGNLVSSSAQLRVSATPGPGGGMNAVAKASFGDIHARLASRRLDAGGVKVDIEGSLTSRGTWNVDLELRLERLDGAAGATVAAQAARLGAKIKELQFNPEAPEKTAGDIDLKVEFGSLSASNAAFRVLASKLAFDARSHLDGAAPYSADLDLSSGELQLSRAGEPPLVRDPVRIHLGLENAAPDLEQAIRSTGVVRLALEVGATKATVAVTKKAAEAADYTLTADAPSLAQLQALGSMFPDWRLPWDQTSFAIRSNGHVGRLGSSSPLLRERTELRIEKVGVKGPSAQARADGFDLTLSSEGDRSLQTVEAELGYRALQVGEARIGDGKLVTSAAFDLSAPTFRMRVDSTGDSGPTGALAATAAFDRDRGALTFDLTARVGRLPAIAPLLEGMGSMAGVGLERLEVSAVAHGTLTGAIQSIGRDGKVVVAPKPFASVGGESKLELKVGGLSYHSGDLAVEAPAIAWTADFHGTPELRTLLSDLRIESLHAAQGRNQVDLAGFSDSLEISSADPLAGELDLRQQLAVRDLRQNAVRGYPIGEMGLSVRARRERDGTVRISELTFDNRAAGTLLALHGRLEITGERRAIALSGQLDQDLGRAWRREQIFKGSGKARVQWSLESTDLHVFRTLAEARISDAQLRLPEKQVEIDALDADVPIAATFTYDSKGLTLLHESRANPFAELRFADQHPFKSRRSFLSIGRLATPAVTIAPLAGNLEIAHGVVSLSQLELGVRNGRVTGECSLNLNGKDSVVVAHVRASGVESSYGEPFDGNLAVSFSARERSLDGRAEILRIGRRHLLDLLDFQDPHRTDGSLNRIRRALDLGYPDHVRLSFSHGFASLGVTFGGLARLVRVDEVRGIPVGPLIDKALADETTTEEP